MDREYSQFEFLSKYDQEIVIQYLGSLHLCEFNSPFASRQSRLIIQALINCDGTEKINGKRLRVYTLHNSKKQ